MFPMKRNRNSNISGDKSFIGREEIFIMFSSVYRTKVDFKSTFISLIILSRIAIK